MIRSLRNQVILAVLTLSLQACDGKGVIAITTTPRGATASTKPGTVSASATPGNVNPSAAPTPLKVLTPLEQQWAATDAGLALLAKDGSFHATYAVGGLLPAQPNGPPTAATITITPGGVATYFTPSISGENAKRLPLELVTRLLADVAHSPPSSPAPGCSDGASRIWHVAYAANTFNNENCGSLPPALNQDLLDLYDQLFPTPVPPATPKPLPTDGANKAVLTGVWVDVTKGISQPNPCDVYDRYVFSSTDAGVTMGPSQASFGWGSTTEVLNRSGDDASSDGVVLIGSASFPGPTDATVTQPVVYRLKLNSSGNLLTGDRQLNGGPAVPITLGFLSTVVLEPKCQATAKPAP